MQCEGTPHNIWSHFDERQPTTKRCDRSAAWTVTLNRPGRPENGRLINVCTFCREYDYRMHPATPIPA
jgi:hypothetical protein